MSLLPNNHSFALETAPTRRKLVQVTICTGSSCGKPDKGSPELPIDWLKAQWKERKLLKTVQLTIGGCFGACDLTNVASIQSESNEGKHEVIHLGKLGEAGDYEALLEWATQVAAEERILPLPERFQRRAFRLFRDEAVLAGAADD
jgi:hypothetical protein